MNTLKLPAFCTEMTEHELADIKGGSAAETAAIVAAAIGSGVLLAGVVVAVLSFVSGDAMGAINGSMQAGQNFIEGSVQGGQDLLDSMMGK